MTPEEQIAARYPSMVSAQPPPAPPTPPSPPAAPAAPAPSATTEEDERHFARYPSMRPTAPKERYSLSAMYEPDLKEGIDTLANLAGFQGEERQEYLKLAASWLSDLDAVGAEARALHNLAVMVARNPASPEQIAEWGRQAERDGRYGFGHEYEPRLAALSRFLARRPDLTMYLQTTGLGNHPIVFRHLLERAYAIAAKP